MEKQEVYRSVNLYSYIEGLILKRDPVQIVPSCIKNKQYINSIKSK